MGKIYNSLEGQAAEQQIKWLTQLYNQFATEAQHLRDPNKPYGLEQMYAQRRAVAGRLQRANQVVNAQGAWLDVNAPEWKQRALDAIDAITQILAAYDAQLGKKVPGGQSYLEALQTPVGQSIRDELAAAIEAELG